MCRRDSDLRFSLTVSSGCLLTGRGSRDSLLHPTRNGIEGRRPNCVAPPCDAGPVNRLTNCCLLLIVLGCALMFGALFLALGGIYLVVVLAVLLF